MFTNYDLSESLKTRDLKSKLRAVASEITKELPEGFEKKEFESLLDDALFFLTKGIQRKERQIECLEEVS